MWTQTGMFRWKVKIENNWQNVTSTTFMNSVFILHRYLYNRDPTRVLNWVYVDF